MNPKISIEADVSQLDRQLADIAAKRDAINQSNQNGLYQSDTAQAQRDVDAYTESLNRLADAFDRLQKSGHASSEQFQQVHSALKRAPQTINRVLPDADQTYDFIDHANHFRDLHRDRLQRDLSPPPPPIPPAPPPPLPPEPLEPPKPPKFTYTGLNRNDYGGDRISYFDWGDSFNARQQDTSHRPPPKNDVYKDIYQDIDVLGEGERLSEEDERKEREEKNRKQREAKEQREREAAETEEQRTREARYRQIAHSAALLGGGLVSGSGFGAMFGSQAGNLLGMGIGAMTGGLGAFIAPALLGAVGGKIGGLADVGLSGAEKEAVDYSQLRHMIGSASVDFNSLRDSTRELTHGFGVTYNEAVGLAKQFAHTSALSADDKSATRMGNALHTGAGWAQGYGIEASITTQFLATQTLFGVAKNETDDRKLALQIGEAVSKSGTGAKMDEVLGAIANFTKSTAAQSLITPDVSAYTSLLGTLMESRQPGLNKNPEVAANILAQADAGFRNANSEPQQNFLLAAFHRQNNAFNAYDVDTVKAAGLLASGKDVFAVDDSEGHEKDSLMARIAREKGDTKALERYRQLGKDDTPNLKVVMDEIVNFSKRGNGSVDVDATLANLSSMLGVKKPQAAALWQMYDKDGGQQWSEDLKKYGLDEKNIKIERLAAVAPLINAGTDEVVAQYQRLQDAHVVKADEKKRIDSLFESGKSEDAKREVIKLTANNDTDEGQVLKMATVSMSDNMQKLVDGLIPTTIMIKEGIAALASVLAPTSAFTARNELNTKAQELGVSGFSAENSSPEQIKESQRLLNNSQAWAKSKDAWWGISESSARQAALSDLNTVKAHPENYTEGFYDLLKASADKTGLTGSDLYAKDDKQFHLNYNGETLSHKPLTESVLSNSDKMVKEIMAYKIRYQGDKNANQNIKQKADEFLKQVEKNPDNYAANMPDFLGQVIKVGGDTDKLYTAPKPADDQQKREFFNAEKADATLKDKKPIAVSGRKREIIDKITSEARRQGNTNAEIAKIIALTEQESSIGTNMTGRLITSGVHKGDRAYGIFQMMAKTAQGTGVNRHNDAENIAWGVGSVNKFAKKLMANGIPYEEAFNKALAANLTGERKEYFRPGGYPGSADLNGTNARSYISYINRNDDKYLPLLKGTGNVPDKIPSEYAKATRSSTETNINNTQIHKIEVTVKNDKGQELHHEVIESSSRVGAPQPTGTAKPKSHARQYG